MEPLEVIYGQVPQATTVTLSRFVVGVVHGLLREAAEDLEVPDEYRREFTAAADTLRGALR